MAATGSNRYGGRLLVHRMPSLSYWSRARRKLQFQVQSLWAARDCDVIYNHGRFDYLESLLQFRKPLLHAFHNPISQKQIDIAESRMGSSTRAAFHCISASQSKSVQFRKPVYVIPNPVDVSSFDRGGGGGGYLVFLGRLTHGKGVDVAIAVAKRTGRPLVIAGNISLEERGEAFFKDQVQPHIDGQMIRWVGSVNDQQKQQLLSHAEALLFPIRWEEPFGIVMIEALACGCPVIATHRASTPEVIEHGTTGFLCDSLEPSVDEFVAAVHDLGRLNRSVCRDAAENRFDVRKLAPKVLNVLAQLAEEKIN